MSPPNLFGLDIAGIAAGAIDQAGGWLPATLTVVTAGTRTVGALAAGTNPTSASHACKGCIVERVKGTVEGTLANRTASKVAILGATLPAGVEPKPTETITIESTTYRIVAASRDAAGVRHLLDVAAA